MLQHRRRVQQSVPAVDLLHDTPLRYLGYANEVTETGRSAGVSIARALNPWAWGITLGYGMSDAVRKGLAARNQTLRETGNPAQARREGLVHFGEGLFFHTVATWVGPVFCVIKPVYKLTGKLMEVAGRRTGAVPALAALGSIGVTPRLLDPVAERLVEQVYRPAVNGTRPPGSQADASDASGGERFGQERSPSATVGIKSGLPAI